MLENPYLARLQQFAGNVATSPLVHGGLGLATEGVPGLQSGLAKGFDLQQKQQASQKQQQQQELWQQLWGNGQQQPEFAKGLPQGMAQMVQAAGPERGAPLLMQMIQQQRERQHQTTQDVESRRRYDQDYALRRDQANKPDFFSNESGTGYFDPANRTVKMVGEPRPRATDDMREYEVAKQQGFKGSFLDYKTSLAAATTEGRPLTEHESKDALLSERLIRSEADMAKLAASGYDPTHWSKNYWPDSPSWKNAYTANLANSKEWQQYQRGAREGIAAILRKDTGAAVTDEEWEWYFPMFYPQPGDGPEVTGQKKAAREAAAQGLRGSSGRAFDRMFPGYDNRAPPGTKPQGALPAGSYTFDPATGQLVPAQP